MASPLPPSRQTRNASDTKTRQPLATMPPAPRPHTFPSDWISTKTPPKPRQLLSAPPLATIPFPFSDAASPRPCPQPTGNASCGLFRALCSPPARTQRAARDSNAAAGPAGGSGWLRKSRRWWFRKMPWRQCPSHTTPNPARRDLCACRDRRRELAPATCK